MSVVVRVISVLIAGHWLIATAHAGAIQIAATSTLAFGRFATTSAGTVTISPAGVRSATGGVALMASTFGAALMTVTGDANQNFSILLPTTATLTSGSNTLTLDTFVSSPEGSGTLSSAGSSSFTIGARLDAGVSPPTGNYEGTFDVIVNYN